MVDLAALPRRASATPAVLRSPAIPAGLMLASVVLLRPGLFGEAVAPAGLALVLAALVAAFARREHQAPRRQPAVTVLVALVALAYLWLLLRGAVIGSSGDNQNLLQDLALTVGSVAAGAAVLADPPVRRAVGRGFVVLVAVVCASWVVTALWWAVAGIGTGQIGSISVGYAGVQPLYLPFTVGYGDYDVFGTSVPRLAGLGREAGWMAMYCAAAFFMAGAVGYRSRVLKALLLAGLVGTLSTAGFGVFVVVWTVDAFLRGRGRIAPIGMLRQIVGLGVMAGAAWLALDAPVLGVSAKEDANGTSLTERQDATDAGLRALTGHPWGGTGSEKEAGINLISDVAVNGLPFVVLVTAALLLPTLWTRGRGAGGAVALVVFLTMLLSQPAAASSWAFLLVALAYSVDGLTDAERAVAGGPLLTGLHRWLAGRRRAPSTATPDPARSPRTYPSRRPTVTARQYLDVLREDRRLIAIVVVVCVVLAFLVTLVTPNSYSSGATFYVASPPQDSSPTESYQGAQLSTERVKSYTELLEGTRVAADASQLLGGTPRPQDIQEAITTDAVAETVVIQLSVTERSPQEAQLVASAVSTAFTRLVAGIESNRQPLNRPIVTVEIIQPPTLPESPDGPLATFNLLVGLLIGIVLGIGIALVRRSMGGAVTTSRELAEVLGAPILGTVPTDPSVARTPIALLATSGGEGGPKWLRRLRGRAEAYRRIRTGLQQTSNGRRVVVITSAAAGEGKTLTACNLAVALAGTGGRVVLVESDLRSPAVASTLGLDPSPGITGILDGRTTLAAAVQRWAPGGIDVLARGPAPERPNELLASSEFAEVVAALRRGYDWVLLDAPAVLPVADATSLAGTADGVVMVCRRGRSRPEELETALAYLATARAPVLGAVFSHTREVMDAVPEFAAEPRNPVAALPAGTGRPEEAAGRGNGSGPDTEPSRTS